MTVAIEEIGGLSGSEVSLSALAGMAYTLDSPDYGAAATGFAPLTTQNYVLDGAGRLLPLVGSASDYNGAYSATSFEPLETTVYEAIELPELVAVTGSLVQLTGTGNLLTGVIGGATTSFEKMTTLASDYEYDVGITSFLPMTTVGLQMPEEYSYFVHTLGSFGLVAYASQQVPNSMVLTCPAATLSAFAGATTRKATVFGVEQDLTVPSFTVNATGTAALLGESPLTMPRPYVSATATVGRLAGSAIVMPKPTLAAYAGGTSANTLRSRYTLSASASAATSCRAALTMPKPTLSGTATVRGAVSIEVSFEPMTVGVYARTKAGLMLWA
jgi:hypothetical protein